MFSVILSVIFFSLYIGPLANVPSDDVGIILLLGAIDAFMSTFLAIKSTFSSIGIAKLVVKAICTGGIGIFDFILAPICWLVFFLVYVTNFSFEWICKGINGYYGVPPEGIFYTNATATGFVFFIGILYLVCMIKNLVCVGITCYKLYNY